MPSLAQRSRHPGPANGRSGAALPIPRCTVLPLPDNQVSFRVDGAERLRPEVSAGIFWCGGRIAAKTGNAGYPDGRIVPCAESDP